MNRKKRETFGPNYKWNEESNFLAFCCYKIDESIENRALIAEKLGIKLSSFDNRMQHFNSLSKNSKDTSSKPSQQVKDIFQKNNNITVDECINTIQEFIGKENYDEVNLSNIDYEKEEINEVNQLQETYLNYWRLQIDYQQYDMSRLPWNDFVKIVSTMNIKSRGMKIEKRIIKNNDFIKSVMNEEGDFWLDTERENGVELKTSFITPLKGSSVSLTGLRLWEKKVKFYLLIVVDISNPQNEPITYKMWVPKEELIKLDEEGRLRIPGMKKSIAAKNLNVARGLNIKKEHLNQWQEKYKVPQGFKL
ncbi:hypothetical protein [Halobacteriovorax sp. DPLXC-1]|uniref:hypothetical protein n=1 Tax=Halobacteriovorax sp. DPLXC-1 TaxID=3110771 RepID=UPI002FF10487